MLIPFNLGTAFNRHATDVTNALVLRALLDALTAINLAFIREHRVPDLYKSGVVYGRTHEWEDIPALYKREYGDCKSLTCAMIAQYLVAGVAARPVFRFVDKEKVGKGNGTDYHILVMTKNGFEDPSKVLGMGTDENEKFYGPNARVIDLGF